ncbi:hypothetical protein T492DRAFT_263072 [Pavlovales sp. CCMP2436]|nr:hypothetical protein T492DRAFT_263072 [Pavlovales sp. CCMP2436]
MRWAAPCKTVKWHMPQVWSFPHVTHTRTPGTTTLCRHDDAQAKFDALQVWRRDFKAQHGGREPTLWIDILAIDQRKIKESLACLPLYLAGCQTLLLLAGPSYLTRLWCVIELFVFVQVSPAKTVFSSQHPYY